MSPLPLQTAVPCTCTPKLYCRDSVTNNSHFCASCAPSVLAPLLDPSLTSTERYSSSAALFDPDRATHAFYKFCRRTTTPRWVRTRVLRPRWRAASCCAIPAGSRHSPRLARQLGNARVEQGRGGGDVRPGRLPGCRKSISTTDARGQAVLGAS